MCTYIRALIRFTYTQVRMNKWNFNRVHVKWAMNDNEWANVVAYTSNYSEHSIFTHLRTLHISHYWLVNKATIKNIQSFIFTNAL